MFEHVPAWLGKVLRDARAGHGKLAVARLGGEEALHAGGFRLQSAAFVDGERLDPMFTADEEDACAPPLEWSAPPPGSRALALIVEDPDAPGPEPLVHWLGWGMEPRAGKLLEGEDPPVLQKHVANAGDLIKGTAQYKEAQAALQAWLEVAGVEGSCLDALQAALEEEEICSLAAFRSVRRTSARTAADQH